MTQHPEDVVVRVRCAVPAHADHGDLAGATLLVTVEDVSLADAPSVVVTSEAAPAAAQMPTAWPRFCP